MYFPSVVSVLDPCLPAGRSVIKYHSGGTGITYYIGKGVWLRGEYRFHHISDSFLNDPGINSHDFMLGVSFGK